MKLKKLLSSVAELSDMTLMFPDTSELYHLQSRTAAANLVNNVRDEVIGRTGLVDEFNPHEFFPEGSPTIILKHYSVAAGHRLRAHVIAPNGDAMDVDFTVPPVDLMRLARDELGGLL